MAGEFVDLTYPIEESMTTFNAPWHPSVKIDKLGLIEEVGRETRKITIGTHSGTHVDAPLHFIKEGKTIETIPLSKLIGEVTIIDLSGLPHNGEVSREMLSDIMIGKRVLFKFGWGKHWKKEGFYDGYPYFSKSAAEYLIEKSVDLVGMDTPSPDDSRIKLKGKTLGSETDSPIHKLFLDNGVILVEYLANLDLITDHKGWQIIVLPLPIKGADGAPARACLYR